VSATDVLAVLAEVATFIRDHEFDEARARVAAADRDGLRVKYVAKLGSVAEINRSLAAAKGVRDALVGQIAAMPEGDRLHAEHVFRELVDRECNDLIAALRTKKRTLSRGA
jgi:hypothetical protein